MLAYRTAMMPTIYFSYRKATHTDSPRQVLDIGKSTFRQTGALFPLAYLAAGAMVDIITV